MTKQTAERYALAAAGGVIVALTVGGFWLSYAHLAEVAGQHGLGDFPARRWVWPATLDAFIVAGELLMLRAGLRQVTDRWAIAITATGSVGSIALNVAGVSGTSDARAVPWLDYVVAAVPPTAALLAFGVLMRQIHQLVTEPADRPVPVPDQASRPAAGTSVQRPEPQQLVPQSKPRGGRPPGATLDELVEIGRIAVAEKNNLTRAIVQQAIRNKGLSVSGKRLTEVMNILRPEFEPEPGTAPAGG
ncbi:DUF2637 domain-containing protein [Streptomyces hyaluromycini]|uniref:DUF2637 domain-containing protein n=1 Tax=Streptomyces hyaluromycini TaxID=1377993 RepID=UPI000B5C2E82|nr:DUF2637 domain-containing protein [Streptomyces hyaluromycini]